MERVKSSDVLDPTHETVAAFQATLLGSFRRVGPNSWDDYEFVRKAPSRDGDSAEPESHVVEALIPVQLETRGCEVRLRREGKVLRLRFQPSPEDIGAIEASVGGTYEPRLHTRALRERFVGTYLRANAAQAGLGASAVIVGKLNG